MQNKKEISLPQEWEIGLCGAIFVWCCSAFSQQGRKENWVVVGPSWNYTTRLEIHSLTSRNTKLFNTYQLKANRMLSVICHKQHIMSFHVFRTYELPVNGGTPYDKDVTLETSVSRGCKSIRKSNVVMTPENLCWWVQTVHLLSS